MRLIDVIYRDYVISGEVLKLIKKNASIIWQKHESETAVERWLQTSANRLPLVARSVLQPKATSLIWDAAVKDKAAFEKLREELERKGLKGLPESILALVKNSLELPIHCLIKNYSTPVARILMSDQPTTKQEEHKTLIYGKWRAKITPRIQLLLRDHDILRVIASKMLYDAMFPRGSSWSLPQPYNEIFSKPSGDPSSEPVLQKPEAKKVEQQRARSPESTKAPTKAGASAQSEDVQGHSRERNLSMQEPLFPDGSPVYLYNDRPWESGHMATQMPMINGGQAKSEHDVIKQWTEGFSNPFNSVLMEFGYPFCSLWPIVDAYFGSKLGFFDTPLLAGTNWCLNPPFIESILADTALKILNFYGTPGYHPEKILFLTPCWRDAKFYEILIQLSKITSVSEVERTLTTDECQDNFLQISIVSECPVLAFKIGVW